MLLFCQDFFDGLEQQVPRTLLGVQPLSPKTVRHLTGAREPVSACCLSWALRHRRVVNHGPQPHGFPSGPSCGRAYGVPKLKLSETHTEAITLDANHVRRRCVLLMEDLALQADRRIVRRDEPAIPHAAGLAPLLN